MHPLDPPMPEPYANPNPGSNPQNDPNGRTKNQDTAPDCSTAVSIIIKKNPGTLIHFRQMYLSEVKILSLNNIFAYFTTSNS